ncbi:MAG: class I SAM-dependent methyltransferase [Clostridia bacterium]|nr:class I SAM-dependent methyltransferase [Clostridia bacterium]
MDNMTALVSAFARAYHTSHSDEWVFADSFAEKLLTEEEVSAISQNMSQGISFFAPGFRGTPEEALSYIVDHQLAPSVLVRSAFCERAIENAVRLGCGQVVLFASGYDTFSLRNRHKALRIFELDRPEMLVDKQQRMRNAGLKPSARVEYVGCDLSHPSWKEALIHSGLDARRSFFGSLLGISYYLSKEEFRRLIETLSSIACEGTAICFDYPLTESGEESRRNRELAGAAGEPMKAMYSYEEMETLLSDAGFLIFEHLNAAEATEDFIRKYNEKNEEHRMTAPEGVGYCLAVKKVAPSSAERV